MNIQQNESWGAVSSPSFLAVEEAVEVFGVPLIAPEDVEQDVAGYLYLMIDVVNFALRLEPWGYIGSRGVEDLNDAARVIPDPLEDGYQGSGVRWTADVLAKGRPVAKFIVATFEAGTARKEIYDAEDVLLKGVNAAGRPEFYNLTNDADGCFTTETALKMVKKANLPRQRRVADRFKAYVEEHLWPLQTAGHEIKIELRVGVSNTMLWPEFDVFVDGEQRRWLHGLENAFSGTVLVMKNLPRVPSDQTIGFQREMFEAIAWCQPDKDELVERWMQEWMRKVEAAHDDPESQKQTPANRRTLNKKLAAIAEHLPIRALLDYETKTGKWELWPQFWVSVNGKKWAEPVAWMSCGLIAKLPLPSPEPPEQKLALNREFITAMWAHILEDPDEVQRRVDECVADYIKVWRETFEAQG